MTDAPCLTKYDWPAIAAHLDAHGWAMLETLLAPADCDAIAHMYQHDDRFRSHVVMARHGFGRGG